MHLEEEIESRLPPVASATGRDASVEADGVRHHLSLKTPGRTQQSLTLQRRLKDRCSALRLAIHKSVVTEVLKLKCAVLARREP